MHGSVLELSPGVIPRNEDAAGYRGRVIRRFSRFLELAEEWNDLVAHSGEVMITIEHGWLHAWLKNFSGSDDLFVVTVRNAKGELAAAAPFRIRRAPSGLNRRLLRHLQFIGTEPCLYDEMKIIIRQGEDEGRILRLVAEQLGKSRHCWDVLDLRYVPDRSQSEALLYHLRSTTFRGEVIPTMSCPFMNLPESLAVYEKLYPSNMKKLRQQLKLVAKAGYEPPVMEMIRSPLEISYHLEIMAQWHSAYWEERGSRSNFERFPRLRNFYSDLLILYAGERPKVRFFVLKLKDDVLAYDIGLQRINGYLGHLGAYNREFSRFSPGFLLDEMLLQYGITQGDRCYYLGRGNEPHKARWQNDEQPLWNLLAFSSPLAWQMWRMDDRVRDIRNKLLRR